MSEFRRPSLPQIRRRRLIALLILVALVIVVVTLVAGGGSDDPAEPSATTTTTDSPAPGLVPPEEAVDQVLLLGFEGTDAAAGFARTLERRELGGVLVRSENWLGSASGTALVGGLRAAGRGEKRIPPLIVTNQEGGVHRSLPDLPPLTTELEIGDEGSRELAEGWAEETARALSSAGFDLNLFPVADVATLDSPLGDRAFSDDPATVAELTSAALRGCRRGGIACAPLHFPGLGAASEDTNAGPATVGLDPGSLAARDLLPFEAAFALKAPAVVLSLAFYSAYDPITPGALAEPVATGLLRDELGFDGVAISDDLGAGAIRAGQPARKAAVAALAAGTDLVQIGDPADQRGVREAILEAVESGDLSAERLSEAAERVIAMKRSLGLLDDADADASSRRRGSAG